MGRIFVRHSLLPICDFAVVLEKLIVWPNFCSCFYDIRDYLWSLVNYDEVLIGIIPSYDMALGYTDGIKIIMGSQLPYHLDI